MIIGEITALEQTGFPVLSTLIVLPVLWCLFILFYRGSRLRELALAGAIIELVLAMLVLIKFQSGIDAFQFTETAFWIPTIGAGYHLGVDGINVLFIPLTAIITVILILASWCDNKYYRKQYFATLFIMEATTLGIFTALDLILYFIFWELALVPLFLMIKFWGIGHYRRYAGQKYMLYMLAGSAPLLIGFLLLGINHIDSASAAGVTEIKTFDLIALMNVEIPIELQTVILFFLVLGFAVKLPVIPFHAWLPSSLMEGPPGAAAFLVGVKLGIYGLLRFVVPLVPQALMQWGWILAILSVVAIIYSGLIALVQPNLRRLIAFSSISHVGLILLGIASLDFNGIQGVVIALFHLGIVTTTLLLMTEFLYMRYGSTDINSLGGLAQQMPKLSAMFFILGLAYIAVPGTSGFTSEFLILFGAFNAHWSYAVPGLASVILSASCFLWYFQRAFCGEVKTRYGNACDLNWREWLIIAPAAVIVFWLGLFPEPFLDITGNSVQLITQQIGQE